MRHQPGLSARSLSQTRMPPHRAHMAHAFTVMVCERLRGEMWGWEFLMKLVLIHRSGFMFRLKRTNLRNTAVVANDKALFVNFEYATLPQTAT